MRLRGRLDGRRIVPYYDRGQIELGQAAIRGREIVWVDDAIELFFLQIQGSGRIALEGGETLRIGYADQNGHPYRSIGRLLVERGEMPLEKASMQGIQAWARANPAKVTELLNQNASYVFFRELPADLRRAARRARRAAHRAPQRCHRSALRAARRPGLSCDHVAAIQPAPQPPDAGAGHGRRDPRRDPRRFLLGLRPGGRARSRAHETAAQDVGAAAERFQDSGSRIQASSKAITAHRPVGVKSHAQHDAAAHRAAVLFARAGSGPPRVRCAAPCPGDSRRWLRPARCR